MLQKSDHEAPQAQPNIMDNFETPTQTVPLKNRLAQLGLSSEPTSVWLPPTTIANKIGSNFGWVKRTTKQFGITSEEKPAPNGRGVIVFYPPLTLELMQDEWDWQQSYSDLKPKLSNSRIAEFIGRSAAWTQKTLDELEAQPIQMKTSYRTKEYPRAIIKTLREINLATPLDDGWHTLSSLAEQSQQNPEWIVRRLGEANIIGETRRSAISGRLLTHYPPKTPDVIATAIIERPTAGGTWLTSGTIAAIVPKSVNWILKRIHDRYKSQGEIRQDDCRVNRPHYPPTVLDELLAEAEELENYLPIGDYLSSKTLAKKIGHSIIWLNNRRDIIDISPEERIDNRGMIINCYPPEAGDKFLDLPDDILKQVKHTAKSTPLPKK